MAPERRRRQRGFKRRSGLDCGRLCLGPRDDAASAPGRLGVIQGIMQALSAGARTTGIGWIVAPVAVVMGLAIGGSVSAWFSGTARIPFVAGLDSALPSALGRVHPKWRTPHVALGVCAVLAALFTAVSLSGSSVAEAYQFLLKSAIVLQMIPFAYLFIALARLPEAGVLKWAAGWLFYRRAGRD